MAEESLQWFDNCTARWCPCFHSWLVKNTKVFTGLVAFTFWTFNRKKDLNSTFRLILGPLTTVSLKQSHMMRQFQRLVNCKHNRTSNVNSQEDCWQTIKPSGGYSTKTNSFQVGFFVKGIGETCVCVCDDVTSAL